MNTCVTAATPTTVARDLSLQLLSGMYSGLPVVDSKSKVVGVVTSLRSFGCFPSGQKPATTTADEIMTKPTICVHEDEDVEGVIAKMTNENIIRLRVKGEDGRQEH